METALATSLAVAGEKTQQGDKILASDQKSVWRSISTESMESMEDSMGAYDWLRSRIAQSLASKAGPDR